MPARLKALVAASGSRELQLLTSALSDEGLIVAAAMASRSLRPNKPVDDDFLSALPSLMRAVPDDVDFLLPSSASNLCGYLSGCALDLIVVFGFNWRLPADVVGLPRLGAVNVHLSALPRYRGPSPVPWAIRNGDQYLGATVHRMDEGFDTGPILGQVENIEIPSNPTPEGLWPAIAESVAGLLRGTLPRVVAREPGEVQDERQASYAAFPPDDWYVVNWHDTREQVHNTFRFLNYVSGGSGHEVELNGKRLRVRETSLQAPRGLRVDCADGPLWITSWAAAG